MARDHFWLAGRQALVELRLIQLRKARTGPWHQGLELGCGGGALLKPLSRHALSLTGIDGHASLLTQARRVHPKVRLLGADVTATGLDSGTFDLIGAFDVLEHVDPDDFLGEARRLATPGADLLLSVPAFPTLWSDMDERAGHRCRYRWQELRRELLRQGWTPMGHTHYQFLLFPLAWLSRRLPSKALARLERRPSAWMERLLGSVNAWEVGALERLTLPWGTSLFVWARAGS